MIFENSRYICKSIFRDTCTISLSQKVIHTKCEYAKKNFSKTFFTKVDPGWSNCNFYAIKNCNFCEIILSKNRCVMYTSIIWLTLDWICFAMEPLLYLVNAQCNFWIADTYESGQNCPLFGGVRFSEFWSKFSIFKLFTFFFALSRYEDIFWHKGWANRLYLE